MPLPGRLDVELDDLEMIVADLPASLIDDLSDDPTVKYISPNRGVKPKLDYATPAVNATTSYASTWTGEGVGIAIVDSGVITHADITGRVAYSESFVGDGKPATDLFGHGTHVAGIAAGNGLSSTGKSITGATFNRAFRGIAPKATIINLKVLDSNGAGTVAGVLSAIARAIELQKTYNIKVLNLSLGHPVYESYQDDPLCSAVEKAWKAGIVVVVAAGNDGRNNSFGNSGYGTINSPANSPFVITVGAMKTLGTASRNDDQIASYSSKGPTFKDHIVKPDIVAPGNQIASLLFNNDTWIGKQYPQNVIPYSYFHFGSYFQNWYFLYLPEIHSHSLGE